MGAVLEMTRLGFIGAASLALLAACGPLNEGGFGSQVAGLIAARTGLGPAPEPAAAPAPAGVPKAQALANPGTLMRVGVRNTNRFDTMVIAGRNGSRVTWVDTQGMAVTLEGGLIVATRGLPRDLMGAEVGESRAALRSGSGSSRRIHDYLDDLDQIQRELLLCSIETKARETIEILDIPHATRRLEETCRGEVISFTNIYWVKGDGRVLRSLQAVSPEAGYLQIDVY